VIAAALLAVAAAPGPELAAQFSSLKNDYNPSMDAGERVLVFARSEADFQQARIMIAEKKNGRWSEPKPIGFTDQRYSDTDPWLTPDGRTLYFISNRPTAGEPDKKDIDIWRASRTAGGWSAPEHLGPAVNSKGPELGVEFRDGILYFSSVRKGGKGGLDIYTSRLGRDGFEAPQPMGAPFNTAESDSDFTLSPDGQTAAFWRGGPGGTIHIARRTTEGWSAPVPLPAAINHGPFNFTPAFSRDGKRLWFASTKKRAGQAEGLADIYVATLPTVPK
jgi:dipeptidyl aminopeptidase/acylaminoacyl peptidase